LREEQQFAGSPDDPVSSETRRQGRGKGIKQAEVVSEKHRPLLTAVISNNVLDTSKGA